MIFGLIVFNQIADDIHQAHARVALVPCCFIQQRFQRSHQFFVMFFTTNWGDVSCAAKGIPGCNAANARNALLLMIFTSTQTLK